MKRRGELSMEVIIVAAIALLVLVILSYLLLSRGKVVGTETSCQSSSTGGICVDRDSSCDDGYIPGGGACGDTMKCCVPLNRPS